MNLADFETDATGIFRFRLLSRCVVSYVLGLAPYLPGATTFFFSQKESQENQNLFSSFAKLSQNK